MGNNCAIFTLTSGHADSSFLHLLSCPDLCRVSGCFHLNVLQEITSWGAAVAQWIHLHLPSCRPRFESQAHYLCFYQFKFKLSHVEKTKYTEKEAGIGPFCKKKSPHWRAETNGQPMALKLLGKNKINVCFYFTKNICLDTYRWNLCYNENFVTYNYAPLILSILIG